MSGVSLGGSGPSGGNDPVLQNLAILADPAKFQERLELLQKATLESTEAWTRIRKAETADAMYKDAEKALAAAKASVLESAQEAERIRAQAQADALTVVSKAKADAEALVESAKAEAGRLRSSAKAARDGAAAKEAKAEELVRAAETKMAAANAAAAVAAEEAASVAAREVAVAAREEDVAKKVQALAGMADILKLKA